MQEPIDMYFGFDSGFFHRKMGSTGAAAVRDRTEAGEKYRNFLGRKREELNAALNGEVEPESLPKCVYDGLFGLAETEASWDTLLSKDYKIVPLEVSESPVLKEVGVKLSSESENYVCGRVMSHLTRLMLPKLYKPDGWDFLMQEEEMPEPQNAFCAAFARDFVLHVSRIRPNFEDYELVSSETIGSEGDGVFTFWTIAPYVHLDLMQRDLDPEESMAAIFDWIRASTRDSMQHTQFGNLGTYMRNIPLGYDERMPTHLRARLFGKYTGKRILQG